MFLLPAEILFWSRKSEDITGYAAAEMIGNPKAWELLIPDTSYRERLFRELMPLADYSDMEIRLQTKDAR